MKKVSTKEGQWNALSIIGAVVLVGLLAWQWLRPPSNAVEVEVVQAAAPLPSQPVALEGVDFKGQAEAPLVLLQFSEFQCPYCKSFALNTLPEILAEYVDTGKVRFGFRHFPLTAIHPEAMGAAAAVECAGEQGRFWEMHDGLFQSEQLGPTVEHSLAATLGLDTATYRDCLANSASQAVTADIAEATRLKVDSTPTFFLGKEVAGELVVQQRFSGAMPTAQLRVRLDELLASEGGIGQGALSGPSNTIQ